MRALCSRQVQDSWILYRRWCDGWYRYLGDGRRSGKAWTEKAREEANTTLQRLGKELQREWEGFEVDGQSWKEPKGGTKMFDSGGGGSQSEYRSLGRSESYKYTQTKANEPCSLFRC